MIKPYLTALLLCLFFNTVIWAEVLIDPPSAPIPARGESIRVEVTNPEDVPLEIDFMSGSESILVQPATLVVDAGATGVFVVENQGDFTEEDGLILMISEREDLPYIYSLGASGQSSKVPGSSEAGRGEILFFYTPGCLVCERFISDLVPELEKKHGITLNVEKLNAFDPGSFEILRDIAAERGRRIEDFPALVTDTRIFLGEEEILHDFPLSLEGNAVDRGIASGDERKETAPSGEGGIVELRWLPVFLAGLLDGINPCAFTTLIFLISYLRFIGRKGRDIIWIGGSFSLAVFLCYFLIGLGAFQFLRAASSFGLVAALIRYILGAGLLILAVLSLVDYIRVRQGRASDSILQLSSKRKKKIHSTLRNSSRSALLCLSSFGAGFLISLYELGCTGQIYLPMLVYMLKQGQKTAFLPLLLYNTAFILPLIAVFFLFYKGSDSDKIGALFMKYLGKIKLMTALMFLVMGLFVLLY